LEIIKRYLSHQVNSMVAPGCTRLT